MSSKGRILWNAPEEEEAATFEERTLPADVSGIEQRVMDFDTSIDMQWRRFFHRLDVETDSEDESACDPEAQGGSTGALTGVEAQCGSTGALTEVVGDGTSGDKAAESPGYTMDDEDHHAILAHAQLQSDVKGHKYFYQLSGLN